MDLRNIEALADSFAGMFDAMTKADDEDERKESNESARGNE